MKSLIVLIAGLCVLGSSGAAQAQASPAKLDPVRLQLAHEVMDANGGSQALRDRMKQMMSGIQTMVKANLPAGQTDAGDTLFAFIVDEEVKAVPAMIEDVAQVYAERLTETELRDMLAWATSPSGSSIRAKMPAITQELFERQGPLMKQMMTGIMTKAIDDTCAKTKCTPEDRKVLVAIADQVSGAGKAH